MWATMELEAFLKLMVEKSASDIYFTVGAPPQIRVEGETYPVSDKPLKSEDVAAILAHILDEKRYKDFQANLELNMSLSVPKVGRFRVNVFRQRGDVGIVIRYIKADIPQIEDLNLPLSLKAIVMELRGLVLVVGSTGSGKSTTLASMVDFRASNKSGHILTIEDPIEYLYKHKKSIVDQREVGIDTLSYENALQNAMREAPDMILIGEIRDRSSMKHAVAYAETGHLCLSTLHANNANQALDRIINFFPEDAVHQIYMDLSLNLRAIISLRLVPGVNSRRVPAVEILLNTPHVSDLISRGRIDELKDAMAKGREYGMQTFDQALYELYKAGKISKENAINYADSKNNVALQIRLTEEKNFDGDGSLSIKSDDL